MSNFTTSPTPPAPAAPVAEGPTQSTASLTEWCNNDARYKAPEQLADTYAYHARLFHSKALELEASLAARDEELARLQRYYDLNLISWKEQTKQLQTATERAERAERECDAAKAAATGFEFAVQQERNIHMTTIAERDRLRAVADGLAEALDDLIGVARAAMKQPESEFNVNAELEPAIKALARYRAASADGKNKHET